MPAPMRWSTLASIVNPSDLSAAQAAEDEELRAADASRYLLALAAGQRVAIPLRFAREILGVRAVTRLPGAPSFIAGLVNVRGSVLTVLDVALRLGGEASAGPVVVVEHEERRLGLRVSAVVAVSRASATEGVDEARSAGGAVSGLVTLDDGAALVLDIEALQRAAIADA